MEATSLESAKVHLPFESAVLERIRGTRKGDFESAERDYEKRRFSFTAVMAFKVLTSWREPNAGNKALRIQADRKMIITAVNLSDIEPWCWQKPRSNENPIDLRTPGGSLEIILRNCKLFNYELVVRSTLTL